MRQNANLLDKLFGRTHSESSTPARSAGNRKRRRRRQAKRHNEQVSPHDAGIERLEPRLYMSADGLGDVPALGDGIDVVVDRADVRGTDRLTLRRNAGNLEVVDRRGGILVSENLEGIRSLTIDGRDNRRDRLTIDFAFGGVFSVPAGIEFDAGTGRSKDRVRIIGDPAGGDLCIEENVIATGGGTITLENVEELRIRSDEAGDALAIMGAPDFSKIDVRDDGGDDHYDVAMTDGRVKIRDRGGDDTYRLTPTGGRLRLTDQRQGIDTIDFSDAPDGVAVRLSGGKQDLGIGDAEVKLGGAFDVVVGTPFDDVIIGSGKGNLLLGQAGEDVLDGRGGNDILIGGRDRDVLLAGGGEDIVIGGTTAFDDDAGDLATLLEKWSVRGRFDDRVDHVRFPEDAGDEVYLVAGTTVINDGADDVLDGGRSRDYAPLGEGNSGPQGSEGDDLLGVDRAGGPFLSPFDPGQFSRSIIIDNPFLSFNGGDQSVYEGEQVDEDTGALTTERVVTDVTSTFREIFGITTRGVRDSEFDNGVLVEETIDFFAQDDGGNVWYFGEEVTNFEYDDDGDLVGTNDEGAWIAGENGALPGIIMPASPIIGDNYYQEFAPLDDAIDQAINFALDGEVDVPAGSFDDVLVVREFTEIEPDALENKNYAAGVGLVLVEEDLDDEGEPEFELELVSFERMTVPDLADFDAASFDDPLTIDNLYFPVVPGAHRAYEGEVVDEDTGEVETEGFVLEVLTSSRTIFGVETRGIRDRAFEGDLLVEETIDYYAQDDGGNVWYFGEDVTNFEYDDDGNLIGTDNDGAWLPGENGALPGILMPAAFNLGDVYYQEYAPNDEAIDVGENFAEGVDVDGALGTYEDVRVVRESTAIEPGVFGNKYYAPGIGLVLEEEGLDDMGNAELTIDLVAASERVPLKDAKLNIEHNGTDLDTGFQGFVDGDDWQRLEVTGPGNNLLLTFEGRDDLADLGLTELFFETVEPENAEVPIDEMLDKLGAGHYTIEGPIVEDGEITGSTFGTAYLTHEIPEGPDLLTPAEDAEIDPTEPLVVSWAPVDETIEGEPASIIAYQLIVENENQPYVHMIGKLGISAYLDPSVVSVTIPAGVLEADAEYEWEVLAIEASGNQTLSSSAFSTGDPGEPLPSPDEDDPPNLKATRIIIEHNGTDLDTGFQGFVDSEGWQRLDVTDPDGDIVLTFEAHGELGDLGLTELFFETVEPENSEVSIEQMLEKLPAGNYTIVGPSMQNGEPGGPTSGTAWLTHAIPAPAELVSPEEDEGVITDDLEVSWEPVTETIDGDPVNIIAYQLIIEKNEEPHPNMIGKFGMSMYVGPDVTSVMVPAEFLEPGTAYEWEVLAIEQSGNQTLASSAFYTLGAPVGAEPPDFGEAGFSDPLTVDNEWMPLVVGTEMTYEGEAEDEETGETETERVVTEVLSGFETLFGVMVRGVRSLEFVDDVLVEDTIDYFAQDDDDNVWYFGEDVTNFEYDDDGVLVDTNDDGAWRAGENGALPGIIMPGAPVIGDRYFQEFAPNDGAIDEAINLALDAEISIELGDFADVLVIREFTRLEPDARENKNYAPGIGFILVQEDLDEEGESGFELELVSIV